MVAQEVMTLCCVPQLAASSSSDASTDPYGIPERIYLQHKPVDARSLQASPMHVHEPCGNSKCHC